MNSLLHKNNSTTNSVMWHGKVNHAVQAKLTVNTPGDVYEQEADAMADRVMRIPSTETVKPVTGLIGKSLQRKCAHCEEEKRKPIMRKVAAGNSGMSVSSSFASYLNASKGGGSSLPQGTRSFMENAFSTDFSDVKIHTGTQASEMSKGINAKAFTYENDIYFREGQYNPGSSEGKLLLAHELTHVTQQKNNLPFEKIQRQDDHDTGYHSSEINVRWTDDFTIFFNRVVNATARSRSFRRVPTSALWQNFLPTIETFYRNYSRTHPSAVNGTTLELHVEANYTAGRDIVATDVIINERLEVIIGEAIIEPPTEPIQAAPLVIPPSVIPTPVFFCSKPIMLSGLHGKSHAFFRVGGSGPGNPTYELEHDESCPCAWQGWPRRNDPDDFSATNATCIPAPMISESCLATNWASYPVGQYCSWGPNSNTYTRIIAERCGAVGLRPPGNVPGFDDAPPSAGSSGPSPYLSAFGVCFDSMCDGCPTD
jgi:hypothetical protein